MNEKSTKKVIELKRDDDIFLRCNHKQITQLLKNSKKNIDGTIIERFARLSTHEKKQLRLT